MKLSSWLKVLMPGVFGLGFLNSIVGSIAGSLFSGKQASDEAEENRDFQEKTYRNRYQWTMQDMKLAGLNPILAGKLGVGGGLSGAMASFPDYGSTMNSAFSNVTQRMGTESQMDLNDATIEKIDSEVDKLASEVGLNEIQTEKVRTELPKIVAEVDKIKAETSFREAMTVIPELVAGFVQKFVPTAENSASAVDRIGGSLRTNWDKFQKKLEGIVIEITKSAGDFVEERKRNAARAAEQSRWDRWEHKERVQ